MLRYSYQVELKRYEAKKAGLELDLAKDKDNDIAKRTLEMVEKQIAWLRERIASGNDPGCITL